MVTQALREHRSERLCLLAQPAARPAGSPPGPTRPAAAGCGSSRTDGRADARWVVPGFRTRRTARPPGGHGRTGYMRGRSLRPPGQRYGAECGQSARSIWDLRGGGAGEGLRWAGGKDEALRALLDLAVQHAECEPGGLSDDDVEAMRASAVALGQDPIEVTPRYLWRGYRRHHAAQPCRPGRWSCTGRTAAPLLRASSRCWHRSQPASSRGT